MLKLIERKPDHEPAERVTRGLSVYDHTRGYLGTVVSTFGAVFSVSVDDRTVWLDRSVVAGVIPGESVVLNIDRDEIFRYRIDVNPAA